MRSPSKAFFACSFALVLASCAPKPQPIQPEPMYDKYGAVIVTEECRPSTQPISPNFPDRLPICEEECAPGTIPNPQFTAAAATRVPQCIPVNEGSDNTTKRGALN
jgi:hypothetical protein